MSLTDTKVKNARPAEKAVKLTDGFGLCLLVHPNGSKYWQSGLTLTQNPVPSGNRTLGQGHRVNARQRPRIRGS